MKQSSFLGLLSALAILIALVVCCHGDIIWLSWNSNPQNQAPVTYYLYRADLVTGPYTVIGATNDTNFYYSITPCEAFFYVRCSNFWGMSTNSNITNTPAVSTPTTNVTVRRAP